MTGDTLRLLLTGPTCVTILLSFLASTVLLAGGVGRLKWLRALGARALGRVSHRRALFLLWGLAALLLLLLAATVLFRIKVLALFGLLVLLAGLTLAGLGLGVGAARVGRVLAAAAGQPKAPPLSVFGLGLTTLFVASFLPFAGWLLVILALLAGTGATLDALSRRD